MSSTGINKELYCDYAIFYNDVTCLSGLNVSGNVTCLSGLNVSGNVTCLNSLNVSGNVTCLSGLNVSGNVGIGTSNPNNKLEVLNGAINTTDYKYNNNSLFSFAPANTPTFTNGTQTTINANTYYIQFLTNGTLTIPATMTCDALIVGAGGRGGNYTFGGGGGAGEVIYYPSYTFTAGIYNIQVGVDSTTIANRDTRIYIGTNDYLKATGGGNGGWKWFYFNFKSIYS